MDIEKAIEILKENNYEVIYHEGWGGYTVLEDGISIGYGASALEEEEVIEYVEDYLLHT